MITRRGVIAGRTVRRAYTLVELVATIVVLAIVGSISSFMVFNSTQGYREATVTAQLHAEASVAFDRVVRELRKMDLDDAAAGTAPDIESIDTSSITWNDNSTLALSGTDLMYTESGGTPAVLLGDVSAFTLQAFDESESTVVLPAAAAACDPIRRLSAEITVTRAGVSETLRTRLFLRATMEGGG
jgi:prepilin-type N-terminal cleavage/methylation domain-containing protein